MSIINTVENAIVSLDGGKYQKLIHLQTSILNK